MNEETVQQEQEVSNTEAVKKPRKQRSDKGKPRGPRKPKGE